MSHAHAHAARASVRVFIITCSDTRTHETDESGLLAEQLLGGGGHVVLGRRVVPDEPAVIEDTLRSAIRSGAQVILLNGGTGISRRDRTIDALDRLLQTRIDGFGELFRMLSFEQVGAAAMLSRATAGLFDGAAIFSVPGSPAAVRLALEKLILPEIGHVVSESRR